MDCHESARGRPGRRDRDARHDGLWRAQPDAHLQDRAAVAGPAHIIEIVDTREKLEKFLSLVDNEIEEGMATLENVQIHFYRSGKTGH